MEKSLQEQQFEVLQTADDYIVKLINGINMCIENIRANKQDEAINLTSYIVEGMDWLNEVARLTKDIQDENMDEELMKNNLQRISEYSNMKKYEEILKLLSEEILPLLNSWKCIIEKSLVS
ncbi:hypothetical protein NSA52_12405 [Clostridium sporogenes]|uniref:hypothetical protein n=1 Tax=Clostridium sporogenes TaxID=1509 RepID=UPI002149E6CD|nr:hypothetical protein [Clostridium sporogenes]MCR1974925.1 hypothetical protein [Clostridium sporogenes]